MPYFGIKFCYENFSQVLSADLCVAWPSYAQRFRPKKLEIRGNLRIFVIQSFVWSLLNEDHSVSSQFWAKSNESQSMQLADYIIKEECVSPTGQCVTEGVFTVAGKEFGYQVECGILAEVNAKLGKNIRRIVEREQAIGNTFTEEQILDFAMNKVGQSPLLYRKAIIKTC